MISVGLFNYWACMVLMMIGIVHRDCASQSHQKIDWSEYLSSFGFLALYHHGKGQRRYCANFE